MANMAPQGVATHLSVNGLIGVTWTGAGLGIIFASIRFGIRIKRMKRLLVDDYFVLLALVFLVTNAILQTLQAPHLYYMLLNVTGPDIVYHALKYTHFEFVIIGIFWSVLWSIKGSFLALFWLISDGLPHYRRVWWGVTTFAVLAYIGCWLASILNCHPPSDYFRFGIVVVELWRTLADRLRKMHQADRHPRIRHFHLLQYYCRHSYRLDEYDPPGGVVRRANKMYSYVPPPPHPVEDKDEPPPETGPGNCLLSWLCHHRCSHYPCRGNHRQSVLGSSCSGHLGHRRVLNLYVLYPASTRAANANLQSHDCRLPTSLQILYHERFQQRQLQLQLQL